MSWNAVQLGAVSLAALRSLREQDERLHGLLRSLEELGPLAVVGGAPRDWLLGHRPRDVDLVVDGDPREVARILAPLARRRTRFGGFVVSVGKVSMDIWPLIETWAFTKHNPQRDRLGAASFEALPGSAFFNLDAVVVRLGDGRVFEAGFFQGLRTRTLAPGFTENPFLPLCAARAGVLARRYGVTPAELLRGFFTRQVQQGLRWSQVREAQRSHYGHPVINKQQLRAVLLTADRPPRVLKGR